MDLGGCLPTFRPQPSVLGRDARASVVGRRCHLAADSQTRQVILKCILITPLTSKHWWFSGRILACHAGGPGSIPGRDKVFLFLTVFIHSFNIVLREIRPKPGNLILDENFREFWKNREVREKYFDSVSAFLNFFRVVLG